MDKVIITTDRLYLKEYKEEDYISLYNILADPETMKHYPKPYDEKMVKRWIDWNIENYKEYGFGLWALMTKDTNEFIGDCGITMQKIDGEYLAEIGYHINKNFWKNGFASEAAKAVRDWAFNNTELNSLYSYMTATNVGSYKTAIKNGMKKIKEYTDENNELLYVYRITRDEWKSIKKD